MKNLLGGNKFIENLNIAMKVELPNIKGFSVRNIKNMKKFYKELSTEETLKNIKLELPEVPNIKDIRKVMINRDEKICNEIIKTKDELIKELYQDNVSLHKELSKQAKVIEKAEKYQNERDKILTDNEELHNTVKHLEKELTL